MFDKREERKSEARVWSSILIPAQIIDIDDEFLYFGTPANSFQDFPVRISSPKERDVVVCVVFMSTTDDPQSAWFYTAKRRPDAFGQPIG